MNGPSPRLVAVLLLVVCFGLAAWLQPRAHAWSGGHAQQKDLLTVLMGDSRRIFASHFFVKADAYFHSGYYPSIFDNREAFQTAHIAEDAGVVSGQNKGEEHDFMDKPRDWIERFSRNFFPSVHTHLDEGGAHHHDHDAESPVELGDSPEVREILPWVRMSASLDPQRIETYTTASYWLRQRMGKVDEAEWFLRDGLKANPKSPEILFELGRLYEENRKEPGRARNLWELALRYWNEQSEAGFEPDEFVKLQVVASLAMLEEKEGNWSRAIEYTRLWKNLTPHPQEVEKRLLELQARLAGAK